MRISNLIIVLLAIFAVALAGCKKGGGGSTPEAAVKGMKEAAKAKDWETVVSYMDVESMVDMAKKQMENMPEELKKDAEKSMADMLDVKKARAKMIEEMKKDDKAPTDYKIIETKNQTDTTAVVVVETTEGKETRKDEIPVKKVKGKWMIVFPEGAGPGPEIPEIKQPEKNEPVVEEPVVEEKDIEEKEDE